MLCSFLLFDHNTLSYGYRLLFENNSLLLRGKSKSSLFNFLRQNLTITVSLFSLMRWQDSIWSGEILQPILSKISNTFSFTSFSLILRGMATTVRHSRLEYWTFARHCCSNVNGLLENIVLTFFVTDSSELSLEIVSDKLGTSSRTLLLASLLASFSLPCGGKAFGVRSFFAKFVKRIVSEWCHV